MNVNQKTESNYIDFRRSERDVEMTGSYIYEPVTSHRSVDNEVMNSDMIIINNLSTCSMIFIQI